MIWMLKKAGGMGLRGTTLNTREQNHFWLSLIRLQKVIPGYGELDFLVISLKLILNY